MRELGRSFDYSLQALFLLATLACGSSTFFKPFNVSFDHRALIVDGKRRMLISAGVHYPRATPDMWPGIIEKSKEAGIDVIQTYVFWNGHEPSRGQYYFEDRFDLVKFVKLVGSSGLYFHLRIGPYVCAEWNFGGFPVWLRDIPGIEFRISNRQFKIGLKGEHLKIYSVEENESVEWENLLPTFIQTPFVWYETFFDAPAGINPLAIDLGSMGKGQAWINGHGIGRYWSIQAPKTGCAKTCNYRGTFNENKCVINCGEPTQRWYHIPRVWLQASNNLLVIFEETGGNPLNISLKQHASETICSTIAESHTPPLHIWFLPDYQNVNFSYNSTPPEMKLQCDPGQIISDVTFASFGNPKGECLQYSLGSCHASNSLAVVSNECIGRNNCQIHVSSGAFNEDPCPFVVKSLAVEAICVSSHIDIALL